MPSTDHSIVTNGDSPRLPHDVAYLNRFDNNGVNAMDSGGRQQRGEELAMEPRTRESRETSSDPIAERNGTILQARRLLSFPAGGANL